MTDFLIQNEIIDILKQHTPDTDNTVNLLMKITPMSKEAAYRRLRGEIPFSLEETIRICQRFDISLDEVMKIKREEEFTFHLSPIFSHDIMEEFYNMMVESIEILKIIKEYPDHMIYEADTTLPQPFMYGYKMMCKVCFFKWLYQQSMGNDWISISDIEIPEKVSKVIKEFVDVVSQLNLSIILDDYCFENYVKDVKFFKNINLITDEEALELKKEGLALLNEMEAIASKRYNPDESKISIYICHTFFDANYVYAQYGKNKASVLRIYALNNLSTDNHKVCDTQKKWIESLIRYSTLISGSGELYRSNFFRRQREIINTIMP